MNVRRNFAWRLCSLAVPVLTELSYAIDINPPLPPAYSGRATIMQDYGPEKGWVIGSIRDFITAHDWEISTSGLYHGEELGTSRTTYIYSTSEESFRYDYLAGAKQVGHIKAGVIDRDRFLSPRAGYDLLMQQDTRPIEEGDPERQISVYKVRDTLMSNNVPLFIGVDTQSQQVHWMESRNADGSPRERFSYLEWVNIGDKYEAPSLIEFYSASAGSMKVRVGSLQETDAIPPAPKALGDRYITHDYSTMQTLGPNGESLGTIGSQHPGDSANGNKLTQRLLLIAGVGLILCSGFVLVRRKSGSAG